MFEIPVSVVTFWIFFFQSSFKETFMYDFFKLFQEDECIEKVKKVSISNYLSCVATIIFLYIQIVSFYG